MEKKILFTASTLSHIKNFHLPYLALFRDMGYTVHVAAGSGGELPFADRVFPLPLRKSILSPGNLRVAAELRRIIREERYSLVSAHTSLAAFFTRLAVGGGRGRPLVAVTCHGYLFDQQTPLYRRALLLGAEKLMAPRTDLLFTMNRADYEIATRHHLASGPVVSIPGMGVDLSRFPPPTEVERSTARVALGFTASDFVLIYSAEFSPRKNQETLIRAMARMPARVHLLLAGDGALLSHCRELSVQTGVENRVHFLGHRTEMLPLLHAADIAVSASRYEGLPFNLMEAMAVGLPIVASDVKGNADLVEDGVNGCLYPYGDINTFILQTEKVMDSKMHVALSLSAQEAVQVYHLKFVSDVIMGHYRALLEQ